MHIRNHRHFKYEDIPESSASRAFQAELRDALHQWRANPHEGSELAEPVETARDHILGELAASVVVVEYGSFGSVSGSETEQALRATLREWLDDGRISLAFRHFPLIDSYPHAWPAAQAIEAADRQGRFWQMHEALTMKLSHPLAAPRFGGRGILEIAERVGLDVQLLQHDMERATVAERIFRDFHSGVASGVNGAPTLYVQGVRQDVDDAGELHDRLERALAGDFEALWPPHHEARARREPGP